MGPRNRKESLSPEDGDSSRPECLPRTGWWLRVSCHNTHIIHAANKETKLKDRSTQSGALIKKKKKKDPDSSILPLFRTLRKVTSRLRPSIGHAHCPSSACGSGCGVLWRTDWLGAVVPNLSLEQLARGRSLFLSLRLLSPSASERRVTQVPPSP